MLITTGQFHSQVRISAYDNGSPAKSSVTTLEVNVDRNLNCPQWRSGDQNVEILETHDLGTLVASVEAEDRDNQVKLPPYSV